MQNNSWQVPLSKQQKTELDKAIIDYVQWQCQMNNGETDKTDKTSDLIRSLKGVLKISEDDIDDKQKGQLLLPRKWNSIAQLQRKIMLLESNIKQLNVQVETLQNGVDVNDISQENSNLPLKRWIPKTSVYSSFQVDCPITAIKLHPFLPIVIIGTNQGKIYLYDTLNVSLPILSINAHTRAVTSIDVRSSDVTEQDQTNRNSILIATSSKDLNIRIWKWDSKNQDKYELIKTLTGHDHIISQLKFTKDNQSIVSCSRDQTIKVWNLQSGWCTRTITNAHSDWIRCIDIVGEYILSSGHDTSVRLTHLPTGNGLSIGIGHEFPVESVKFIPLDDLEENDTYKRLGFKYCLTTGRDNVIKMWQIPLPNFTTLGKPIPHINQESNRFKLIKNFNGHTSWVKDLKISTTGDTFFSCSDDKSMILWDIESGKMIKQWKNFHDGFINCIDVDEKKSYKENTEQVAHHQARNLLVSGGIDCKCNILMN